ncbi:unnamed protein product [Mytilus edulis]|uniref:Uncharacterized protein n=1 Tax=Mytilus edulis TaxID=6550 RepID=A0A8S3RKQ8_MYTED|nr:unnamed protein product [Mytilus edulis]
MKGIPVQELAFNLQRERARLFGLGSSRSTGPDNKRQKNVDEIDHRDRSFLHKKNMLDSCEVLEVTAENMSSSGSGRCWLRERRRQEKEDERYCQVMREADEDHCVPMVITRKQELERDQKKYQEVLQAADEDMGIPIVVRINPTEAEQYHQLVKEADEDPFIPPI